MNLSDFSTLILNHDWTAWASDDGRCWRNERQQRKELVKIAETSDEHARLWSLALELFDTYSNPVPDDAEPNFLKFIWSRGIGYRDCFMPTPSHEVIEARWERLGFGF